MCRLWTQKDIPYFNRASYGSSFQLFGEKYDDTSRVYRFLYITIAKMIDVLIKFNAIMELATCSTLGEIQAKRFIKCMEMSSEK